MDDYAEIKKILGKYDESIRVYQTILNGLEELNEHHALMTDQGKAVVIFEKHKSIMKKAMPVAEFKHYYREKFIWIGKRKYYVANIWMEWSGKRKYVERVYDPSTHEADYYNIFKGYTVEPIKGEWKLYRKHIFEVICNGDKEAFHYILLWMSNLVQYPGGPKPKTAIVLRGKQGTGKGTFVNNFGKLFGSSFKCVTQREHLLGKFNYHLHNALLVFVDEAFWAGDKQGEATIKAMITEDEEMIEPKGETAFIDTNYKRLIIASNKDWVVPAEPYDRRFFVLDVSDKYMKNREYFAAIEEEMRSGGREAMLYDLLRLNQDKFNFENYPRTNALFEQIVYSADSVTRFWFELLNDGKLSRGEDDWQGEVFTYDLYNYYLEYAKSTGQNRPVANSIFGKKLKELVNGEDIRRQYLRSDGYRRVKQYKYAFPSFERCRELFELYIGQRIDWGRDIIVDLDEERRKIGPLDDLEALLDESYQTV